MSEDTERNTGKPVELRLRRRIEILEARLQRNEEYTTALRGQLAHERELRVRADAHLARTDAHLDVQREYIAELKDAMSLLRTEQGAPSNGAFAPKVTTAPMRAP